ncbi:MAG: hypothetical protein WCS82_03160 [Candidatus Riflebacteria bacterium]
MTELPESAERVKLGENTSNALRFEIKASVRSCPSAIKVLLPFTTLRAKCLKESLSSTA